MMPIDRLEVDVCVIGGGPAGCAAAIRLARLGHEVCVVDRPPAVSTVPDMHSLPAEALPLLGLLGLDGAAAGFVPVERTLAAWGEGRVRARGPDPLPALIVDRDALGRLLAHGATAAGARLLRPAYATPPCYEPGRRHPWSLQAQLGEKRAEIRAEILVDASGRRSSLHPRRSTPPPTTIALSQRWEGVPSSGRELRIEAGPGCWYWGAAAAPNQPYTAVVFLDPRERHGEQRSADAYRALLARSLLLRYMLVGRPVSSVRACDASPRASLSPIGPRLVRVGEAARTLDPLSSQGLMAALGSALQAAVVANTWLRRPGCADAAEQFYAERQTEAAAHHRELVARSYAEAARRFGTPFWHARTAQAPARRMHPVLSSSTLPGPDVRLRLAADVRWTQTPVLAGDLVELAPAVVRADARRPVAFVADRPVSSLVDWLASFPTASALCTAMADAVGPGRALREIATLWQTGLLEAVRS
jgi:flavin-dependent dehydrogenase